MRWNRMLALFSFVGVAVALSLCPASHAGGQKWYEKAVKKFEASISPAEAKPGQTVTFSMTIELNESYYTYPTVQTDKAAAGLVNIIKFPEPGTLIFVGNIEDPKDPKTKADAEAGIKELRYYAGTATFSRKAVVSPKATAGPASVKLTGFKLSVCDPKNCFLPKDVPLEATLKVLPGSVEVEKQYADEVAKALGK